ncbi:hypothetical protein DTU56_09700 [Salmonella enterica subsp. enterica serovar Muenchen]|uniref:RNA polymerase alpha subunit domain-containing protein n=1 Tax=Salmonella muenchen TaxID=596 RepID=A0A5U8XPZ3_SALMU|nr:hypothetical protein [Salmonella enterica subsp. enterica serovar Muenchen]ECQ9029101.1 hypothetical protein [Salmonella enterica subsp. enterica serovar Enteritidis]
MSEQTTEYYGISGEIENLDNYYFQLMLEARAKGVKPPVVINDIAREFDSSVVTEHIDALLQNRIVNEKLNNTPICSIHCEHPTAHRYNLGNKCPSCGFVVTENRLESEVWLQAPTEMQAFINPRFWLLFNANFGGLTQLKKFDRTNYTLERGADLMMWLIDPNYKLPDQVPSRMQTTIAVLEENCYVRGMENFYEHHGRVFEILVRKENWDKIMNVGRNTNGEPERDRERWIKFFAEQANAIFSRHLPIITSKFIVAEETQRGLSVDPVFVGAIDAVKTIASIYTRQTALDVRFLLGRAIKANRQLAYFYNDLRKETLSQKTGIYRSKVSSTFIPFGGRATISPISEPHSTWDLHAPWRWMVNLMSIDIENKLMGRGYTARECETRIAFACMQYDREIDEILDELIAESPGGKGIMVVMLRNPTLVQLSVETFWITKVIKDVNQCSIRISVRAIKMMNADFDGDQLMVWRPVDKREMDLAMGYRPDNGFMSATNVDEVAHGMVLHNEVISMQNNFLADEEEDERMGTPLDAVLLEALANN